MIFKPYHFGIMVLCMAIVCSFAMIQHLVVLEVPFSDLRPPMFIVPSVVGLLFGFFISRVLVFRQVEKEYTLAMARREEELNRYNIVHHNPAIICGLDSSDTITFINPAGEKITGIDSEDIIGKKWKEVFCQADDDTTCDNLHQLFESLETGIIEVELKNSNGENRAISWNTNTQQWHDNEIREIYIFGNDITERKEAEQKLKKAQGYISNIIDSMPSVLVGVDNSGFITQWNRKAENFTGKTPEEALGYPFNEILPHLSSEMDLLHRSIREQQTFTDHKRAHQVDNETLYEDVTIYPLIANGTDGAVIRIDDVTEKVRMEEMMIQSEKMMTVGGLAAGMAHEINNPLAGMIQTASVLSSRLGENMQNAASIEAAEKAGISLESIKEFMVSREIPGMLENIKKAGSRVAAIVNNMLSFARKGDSSFSSFDISEIMETTLELAATDYDLKRRFDFKQIIINKEYEDDLPPVKCEAAKIQQVLFNILRNGAQAMHGNKTEKPEFAIKIKSDAENNMVRLTIADNGPGMPEDIRSRVFEPFFTTKAVGKGTGLGLSVSYFIITENHGGEMSVTSAPGEGATFRIGLPLD